MDKYDEYVWFKYDLDRSTTHLRCDVTMGLKPVWTEKMSLFFWDEYIIMCQVFETRYLLLNT